jgi:hypothetical protein
MFAVFPFVVFTSAKQKMGTFVSSAATIVRRWGA